MITVANLTQRTDGRTIDADITISGKSGRITYYADGSYELAPAWLETKGIQAAGSKGRFRRAINAAVDAAR